MKLLSPKLDVVFKKIFAEPDNEPLLTDFLASVLDIEPDKIRDIKIVNGEITPEMLADKFVRLDLTVLIDGAKIDIEMQCIGSKHYADRTLYYWAKLYARDLKAGEGYEQLIPTISINVLNFNMFDCKEYQSTFKLMEQNRHELLTNKCRLDFLELKKAKQYNSRQIKRLERWMRFLNVESEEDAKMIATIDPVMEKAISALRTMSEDSLVRQLADMREAQMHDEATYLKEARDEGIEQGKWTTIKMLLDNGADRNIILSTFQLTDDKLKEIMSDNRYS